MGFLGIHRLCLESGVYSEKWAMGGLVTKQYIKNSLFSIDSKGVVHKWRHPKNDIFRPHPLSVTKFSHNFFSFILKCHTASDFPTPKKFDVIYEQSLRFVARYTTTWWFICILIVLKLKSGFYYNSDLIITVKHGSIKCVKIDYP